MSRAEFSVNWVTDSEEKLYSINVVAYVIVKIKKNIQISLKLSFRNKLSQKSSVFVCEKFVT